MAASSAAAWPQRGRCMQVQHGCWLPSRRSSIAAFSGPGMSVCKPTTDQKQQTLPGSVKEEPTWCCCIIKLASASASARRAWKLARESVKVLEFLPFPLELHNHTQPSETAGLSQDHQPNHRSTTGEIWLQR